MPDPSPCLTLPPYPDAGEPCINGSTLALTAVCVNGLRELAWTDVEEFGGGGGLRAASAPCGGCAKSKLLDLAREGKWSAEDTIKALKALG